MNMMQKIESRKAVLIAEMMAEFKKEDSEINGGLGADPNQHVFRKLDTNPSKF